MLIPVRRYFLDEPRLRSTAFRYGFLAFLIALAVFAAIAAFHLPPSAGGSYFGFLIPTMLLFNHLAFQFRWPTSVRVGIRILTIIWCCPVVVYTLLVIHSWWH